jgi:hypothetical protein
MITASTPRRPARTTESRRQALAADLRYRWNNSPHRAVRRARELVDTHQRLAGAVLSTGTTSGPALAYAGLPAGHLNVVRLLERSRASLTGAEPVLAPWPTDWADLRAGRFPDADILLIGAEQRALRQLPTAEAIVAPFRVHLVVDTTVDLPTLRARISKRERWEFNRNRRHHEWRLDEDNSVDAFRHFYHNMHVPTMHTRHSEHARTEAFAVGLRRILRNGRLLFLTQQGRRVAGVLCHQPTPASTLTTRLLGVLDGADEHYDSGAFKALYHLLLEKCVADRTPNVDFFGTEAFVAKGIFQWKRKFSPTVCLPDNHFHTKRLYIRPLRDTPDVRRFLVHNPIIQLTRVGQLEPVYFFDAENPARTSISAKARGLLAPRFIDLDNYFTTRLADRVLVPQT